MTDSSEPSRFPRRILLAVTGLSPQIITETLYALAVQQHPPFIPTEIHLITTSEGAERARLSLLSDEPGWFYRLCRDYGLGGIEFGVDHIHVLKRPGGKALPDIRTPADNELAADCITEQVRDFTADANSALHVSIAGGRKTQGFYAGYALSLFGRPQDRLSHVLIEAPYESHPDFYYPTPDSRIIYTPPPDSRPHDTRDARITLAEIAFVRLREELPQELLEGGATFTQVVTEAQRAMPPVALDLDIGTRTVAAAGERFQLKPAEFAFYWMLAERRRQGRPGVHWSDSGLADEILEYYGRVVNPMAGDYAELEASFRNGVSPSYFDPRKANTNRAIKQALGQRRAKPYLIVPLAKIAGTRYQRFGIDVPAEAITIRTASLPAGHMRQGLENMDSDTVDCAQPRP